METILPWPMGYLELNVSNFQRYRDISISFILLEAVLIAV